MATPSRLPSTSRMIRQLVEQYTPDGTLGRLLVASATAAAGLFGVWLTAVLLFAGTTLAALAGGPITGVVSVLLLAVATLTLWPVYLSAIGRVDSPTAYSKALRDSASSRVEQLTNAYRTGEISETDLDQQLDTVLENDRSGSEAVEPTDRNRTAPEQATE